MITQNELNRLVRLSQRLKEKGMYGDSQIVLEIVKKILENDEKLIDKWHLI